MENRSHRAHLWTAVAVDIGVWGAFLCGRHFKATIGMGSLVFHRQFTVEWGHCDPAGIVFNSRFFEFFDWSAWLMFEAALGVRPADLASRFGIVGIPLVDAKARFLKPAKFNDVA